MKKAFRAIGFLEAFSFLYLLCVAMPMKYKFGHHDATKVPGMIHGLLFMTYVTLAYRLADLERWPRKELHSAFLASVLPLGTLFFDHRYLRSAKEKVHGA